MPRHTYSLCPTCGSRVPIYVGDEGTQSFRGVDTESLLECNLDTLKAFTTVIPDNEVIPGHGPMSINQVVDLLRWYKENPEAVQFIADMLEE